jgi:hypothetical protein
MRMRYALEPESRLEHLEAIFMNKSEDIDSQEVKPRLPKPPTFWSCGGSDAAFIVDSHLDIMVDYPGYIFLVDYISVQLSFDRPFGNDPYLTLDYKSSQSDCQLAFPLYSVPRGAAAGVGPQYILSKRVKFAVDGNTSIRVQAPLTPGPGPIGQLTVQLIGRNTSA